MQTLLENPLPILAAGAVLATLTGLAFLSRRTGITLAVFAGVIVLTLAMLLVEQLVVTPSEQVEAALANILAAVADNNTAEVVKYIDPTASAVLSEAETLMPLVKVEDTGATAIKTQVHGDSATVNCRGRLRGTHTKSGTPVVYFDQVDFQWVRRGDQWLLEDFTAYWKGKPLDSVSSLRSNRVAPATR